MASHNINLLSQAEDHSLKSSNKNASGGVGVQIGTDGVGFYAQASVGKGSAHGNGTTHATTAVNAKDTLTLISGGDTTIQGAQAKGNTVLADIGGNLNIRSEQDTDDYASKQQQASGKVVVGYGASASGSYNQSNVESHYASVTTVSGIGAGEGGFNIHVKGNTDLKGGVIASTADASKNRLDTGSLTFSNIENTASYDASSFGVGYGSGASGDVAALAPSGLSGSMGIPQGDESHSTTRAGIANGTIVVRDGNTDLSGLDRTPDIDAQGLKPIFDAQKVQQNQELGQVVGFVGMRTVGGISEYMANHATTEADQKAWSDGGANKVILHGVVAAGTAALGGANAIGGAIGAAASEAASGVMQDYLVKQGYTPGTAAYNTMMQLASAAIGSVGGGSGAATALQGDSFNRQLHKIEADLIREHAKEYADQHPGMTVEDAQKALTDQSLRQIDSKWADRIADNADASAFLKQVAASNGPAGVGGGTLFDARGTSAYTSHAINAGMLNQTADLYNLSSNIKGMTGSVHGAFVALSDAAKDPQLAKADAATFNQLLDQAQQLRALASNPYEVMATNAIVMNLALRASESGVFKPGDGGLGDRLVYLTGQGAVAGPLPTEGSLAASPSKGASGVAKQPTTDSPLIPVNNKKVVIASGEIDGMEFSDANPTLRTMLEGDPNQPTLIADRVDSKPPRVNGYPNGNMETAHAEIGVIQQAFDAGKTQGKDMSMSVTGKDVCGFCKGDIAAAAQKAGLNSLTITAVDPQGGRAKIYYWTPGMTTLGAKP